MNPKTEIAILNLTNPESLNMQKTTLILLSIFICRCLTAQSLPVLLDGKTDEWTQNAATYTDSENDGSVYDFRYVSAANDENFLYLKLRINPFVKLLENNQLAMYIDGDNNSSTGYQINGIGAELRFSFGARNGYNYYTNASVTHSDLKFRSLPTVTDTLYEIAVARQAIPPAGSSQTIRIFLIDNVTAGDRMPNAGDTFSYTFDNTPVPQLVPVELAKEDSLLLRVVNWNTLSDGLTSSSREPYFRRILQAVRPDVAGFSEMWNSTADAVRQKLNSVIPLQTGSWNTVKLDGGNVIASVYPILQSWLVYPGQRITASLIDLPERFGTDLLVICCHYKCCGGASNDAERQREADATVAFILDAKSPGGSITLPANTPFMIMGDMNFVGDRQQLKTLVTGQIINTQLFGSGGSPDWDNTDLLDALAPQSDKRTAYTWRDDDGSYPPGRLDYQIYSNSNVIIRKQFVLQTAVMSPQRLLQYGLQEGDSKNASDHFPKVSDISFTNTVGISETADAVDFMLEQNFPNPFNPSTVIKFSLERGSVVTLELFDALGRKVKTLMHEYRSNGSHEIVLDSEGLMAGVYFYRLEARGNAVTKKLLLVK